MSNAPPEMIGNTPTSSEPTAERLRRLRTLKEGTISYDDGHISTKCTVRDLSPRGAKLRLPNDIAWPNKFGLQIPTDGITAQCEVRWRDGLTLGVEFIGELQMAGGQRRQMNVTVPVERAGLLRRK